MQHLSAHPQYRPSRTRRTSWLRTLVAETHLCPKDFILPLFVQEGENTETPIPSLPGTSRQTMELAVATAKKALSLGIQAVALFPVTLAEKKDATGSEAINDDNLLCRTVRYFKAQLPEMGIIGDVALDPYTLHGHDGIMRDDNTLDVDATLAHLCQLSLHLAQAGCDIIAPSDMTDGRIGAIRNTLEKHELYHTIVLSYSAKYSSHYYGPFRDSVGSAQQHPIDKRSYQMNPANAEEALREIALDIQEGADMVMIKPALHYLDIISRARQMFSLPIVAYHVSGEYAMLKAAAAQGIISYENALLESLTAIKRAGANTIITYGALEAAELLQQ